MCRKISNNAKKEELENYFERPFKFGSVYEPALVIDSRQDVNLTVITSQEPNFITYSLWGLLPQKSELDGEEFANAINTSNVLIKHALKNDFFSFALSERRCAVLVTGYFIYRVQNNQLYPFLVQRSDRQPFALLGINNVLDDGFVTTSLLKSEVKGKVKKVQNILEHMPVAIAKEQIDSWLDSTADFSTKKKILAIRNSKMLSTHPIAKELFNKEIYYDSMLEPKNYNDLSNNLGF